MKQRIDLRAPLLLALASAFAAPAFAQEANTAQDKQDDAMASQDQATPAATPAPKKALRWSDLDANKDGKLSKSEAEAVPSLGEVFDKADANADGALTGDEYKAYLAANGGASASPPARH